MTGAEGVPLGGASTGLSEGHIPGEVWQTLTVAHGGRWVKLTAKQQYPSPPRTWRRGKVHGFTKRSRSRLFQAIHKIDQRRILERPQFWSLTYPEEWSPVPQDWKRNVDEFAVKMKQRFPLAFFVWKLEPQKRGAPHFHLLVFNSPEPRSYRDMVLLRRWAGETWAKVCNLGDEKHVKAGTEVDMVRSKHGAIAYAAKYTAKLFEDDGLGDCGRYWGVKIKKNYPVSLSSISLTGSEFFTLRRCLRRLLGRRKGYHPLGGPHSGVWAAVLPATIRRLFSFAHAQAVAESGSHAARDTGGGRVRNTGRLLPVSGQLRGRQYLYSRRKADRTNTEVHEGVPSARLYDLGRLPISPFNPLDIVIPKEYHESITM